MPIWLLSVGIKEMKSLTEAQLREMLQDAYNLGQKDMSDFAIIKQDQSPYISNKVREKMKENKEEFIAKLIAEC